MNNQDGADIIHLRIDWCFANIEWLMQFADVVVEVLEKGVSDHCPIAINLEQLVIKKNTPF